MKSLYEKTIAFVLQYIDERKLVEGDQLPSEAQLASLAGVSLVTVRRALSELSAQAVVRREQGRGTFVARPRVNAETTKIGGLRNGLHLDARSKLKTKVLSCQARSCSEEEAKRLTLSAGATVWEVSRLRLLNKRPVIWETSVIPKILAPDLSSYLGGPDTRSLYDLLDEVYGLKEAREEQVLVSRPALPREHTSAGTDEFRVGRGGIGRELFLAPPAHRRLSHDFRRQVVCVSTGDRSVLLREGG